MKKVIPEFKTEQEEAHFWDTHSPLDYPDEFTEVKELFEFTKLEALAAKGKGKEAKEFSASRDMGTFGTFKKLKELSRKG